MSHTHFYTRFYSSTDLNCYECDCGCKRAVYKADEPNTFEKSKFRETADAEHPIGGIIASNGRHLITHAPRSAL